MRICCGRCSVRSFIVEDLFVCGCRRFDTVSPKNPHRGRSGKPGQGLSTVVWQRRHIISPPRLSSFGSSQPFSFFFIWCTRVMVLFSTSFQSLSVALLSVAVFFLLPMFRVGVEFSHTLVSVSV